MAPSASVPEPLNPSAEAPEHTTTALTGALAANSYLLQIAGVDALKRPIATPEAVGVKRTNHAVGVFYLLSQGFGADAQAGRGPYTFDGIMSTGGMDARLNSMNSSWERTEDLTIYWGEPMFGFYRSDDRWAVRRNLQLLTLAGIDFVMLDYTNSEVLSPDILCATQVLLEEIQRLQTQGLNPPRAAFYTNTYTGSPTTSGFAVHTIFNTFYSTTGSTSLPPTCPVSATTRLPTTWFNVDNKPLIIGLRSEIEKLADGATLTGFFTIRESQWPDEANTNKPDSWPWIEWQRPPQVHLVNGLPSVMSVSVAQHAETRLMSTYPFTGLDWNWGRGYSYWDRNHSLAALCRGDNIEEQWAYALAKDTPYVMVTSWNEGGSPRIVQDSAWKNWRGAFDTTAFGFQTGGAVGGKITGLNPALESADNIRDDDNPTLPINLSATRTALLVEFQVTTGGTGTAPTHARLYYRTTGHPNFDETGDVLAGPFNNDGATHVAAFNLGANCFSGSIAVACPGWTGELKQLRFVPPSWGGGKFLVKSIALFDAATNARIAYWNFATGSRYTDGWIANSSISQFGRQSEGTVGGTIVAAWPSISSPDHLRAADGTLVDLNRNKFVRIRLRNSTPSLSSARLCAITEADANWDSTKCKSFNVTSMAPMQEYTLDMSTASGWKGSLRQLTFVAAETFTSGDFSLDYIRIGGSSANVLPAISWEFAPTHYMIDDADMEFSRDVQPSKGDLLDDYYMQLVDFSRKFGGTESRQIASGRKSINVGSKDFSQWDVVTPGFVDFEGDTMARTNPRAPNGQQFGVGGTVYVNNSGRNDIVLSKVARDASNLYFYVKTKDATTVATGSPSWMQLFLDVDGNHNGGCNGYDYAVNRLTPPSATQAILEKCTGTWTWTTVATNVQYLREGNQMHLALPRATLGVGAEPFALQFKWLDNASISDAVSLYTCGDAAPEGRFNYEYVTGTLPSRLGAKLAVAGLSATSELTGYPASKANGTGSFWSSQVLNATTSVELRMDLGANKDVMAIEIGPHRIGRSATAFPRNFQLQYMNSAGSWVLIPGMTFTNYAAPGSDQSQVFRFSSKINARYFRWVGTLHRYDDTGRKFYMQASDFRAYAP